MTSPIRSLFPRTDVASPGADRAVVRIAVDLLGGDKAPAAAVDGAVRACRADPGLHLVLVGPRSSADEVLNLLPAADRSRVEVDVVDNVVGMADSPLRALRYDTTVRAAVAALVDGRADAMVSAGASGAAVTAAVHGLGRVPSVRRPALAATIPALTGPVVLLDLGAGTDATMLDLLQHAVLGTAYAHLVEQVRAPRLGLLSIGSEPGKGDRLRRAVAIGLGELTLPAGARYIGTVEGNDVPVGGPADVVVTDGFTGNVLLKGIEGAYALASRSGGGSVSAPRAAVLLGVLGTVVVCHGAASGPDVASGIGLAARLHRVDISARLIAEAQDLPVEAP